MKITTKGQVTIPLPIRNEFGLKPGTDVEFVAEAGKRRNPIEDWLRGATGVARGKTTTAGIMKLTRGKK